MVCISDGTSKCDVHVQSEIGNLIYIDNVFISSAVEEKKQSEHITKHVRKVFWATIYYKDRGARPGLAVRLPARTHVTGWVMMTM
mgnify:CR=1 FL=1